LKKRIRTSDISNWELKIDAKQGVSDAIYESLANKQDVQAGDIFLVRDGTYLIGTCCMVTEQDLPLLYQSHIYKIRVLNNKLDKYLLLAVLNSPIVKRQIHSKQFTQDIIDTLGRRVAEIILPMPKNSKEAQSIAQETKRIIDLKAELRKKQREVAIRVQGGKHFVEDLEDI
jgi:type I restriction enzyme M protein